MHERSHSDTPASLPPPVDLSAESSSVTSLSNLQPLRKTLTSGKCDLFPPGLKRDAVHYNDIRSSHSVLFDNIDESIFEHHSMTFYTIFVSRISYYIIALYVSLFSIGMSRLYVSDI